MSLILSLDEMLEAVLITKKKKKTIEKVYRFPSCSTWFFNLSLIEDILLKLYFNTFGQLDNVNKISFHMVHLLY